MCVLYTNMLELHTFYNECCTLDVYLITWGTIWKFDYYNTNAVYPFFDMIPLFMSTQEEDSGNLWKYFRIIPLIKSVPEKAYELNTCILSATVNRSHQYTRFQVIVLMSASTDSNYVDLYIKLVIFPLVCLTLHTLFLACLLSIIYI